MSLKIAKRKQLFSVPGATINQVGDDDRSQLVSKVEEKESVVFAGSSSGAKDAKGLFSVQELSQMISKFQMHVTVQDKVVSDLLMDNQHLYEQRERYQHYQSLLKLKENELVKKDVEHYKDIQQMEKDKMKFVEVIEEMERMHTEL